MGRKNQKVRKVRPKRTPKGSKKHQAIKRTEDTHHYKWPKRLYGAWENILLELNYEVHHGYHSFFMRNCKEGHDRDCHHGMCQFDDLCCYRGTTTEWGRRVEFD